MIVITNGPVERIVNEEDLQKWESAGFRLVDPLLDLPEETETATPDPEPEAETETEAKVTIPDNLMKMKISGLRALAKQIGIQGYQNMDKATLAAVIQAH